MNRPSTTEWRVHNERTVYVSPWLEVHLADVELPSGRRLEHHVVRTSPSAALLLHDPERSVLLIHRHRFITDTWGWEIPAGRIEPGETPADAAVREAVEETGWRAKQTRELCRFHPCNGIADMTHHVVLGTDPEPAGEPDLDEADRIAWVPPGELRRIVRSGEMLDGYSLAAVTWALACGVL